MPFREAFSERDKAKKNERSTRMIVLGPLSMSRIKFLIWDDEREFDLAFCRDTDKELFCGSNGLAAPYLRALDG